MLIAAVFLLVRDHLSIILVFFPFFSAYEVYSTQFYKNYYEKYEMFYFRFFSRNIRHQVFRAANVKGDFMQTQKYLYENIVPLKAIRAGIESEPV